MIPYLDLSPEVSSALRSKQPVVALESTIISHGMPYPRNVETALQVEAIVRKNGAIPATIAVINGRMKVGLSKQEITNLGKLGTAVLKVSRRDLPVVIAQGQNGATTVAATMIIADLAGISIFATGGIGGVHRGASESMDVSADLQELARTNVAVVCAGAKSILDLGLTLEYLETQGVPVLGYQTSEFPAFYTRNSGFKVDQSVDSAEELADILTIKWQLGLTGGAVIANPIPLEFQLEYAVMEQAIQQALAKAEKKNIKGKEITPFLLASIEQITGGKSLDANVELVFNNAKLAAQIAEYLRVS
ncbi:MAG: pseudouridine-5'-phosphate glycosidase [Haliscomenobacter sp.]|nr:pseudouridine-5'-phosphate glycosidase [Haliscomenobacter sp.]MBK9492883.1 pseudouridine-5'-phosphate glycosidase [Haliscomenobacter sp.]